MKSKVEKIITRESEELANYLIAHLDEKELDDLDFEDLENTVDKVVKSVGETLLKKLVKKKAQNQNLKI